MIFSIADHVEQIKNGSKTQTRRKSPAYLVGKTYSIQPRARILIFYLKSHQYSGCMSREMVKGIVTFYEDGSGRKVLGLSIYSAPDEASITYNLEFILKHWFMEKNITIIENDEEGNPSIEEEDVKIISEDELAKAYGVV